MSRSHVLSRVAVLLFVFFLTACGGGAGGGPKPSVVNADTTSSTLSLSLVLVDANGASVSRMREEQTFDLVATVLIKTVRQRDGVTIPGSETTAPSSGEVVTFTVGGGVLDPSSGTALTNAAGQARIKFTGGDDAGAYQLKASVTGSRGSATASTNIAIEAVLKPVLRIEILDRNNTLVTTLRGGEIYTVRAIAQRVESVATAAGLVQKMAVVANIPVTFSTDGGAFEPTTAVAFTDAAGVAVVRFRPNVVRATYTMSAEARYDNEDVQGTQVYAVEVIVFELGGQAPGAAFRAGSLDIDAPSISAGGSSVVRAVLRQSDGTLVQRPTQVTFTSQCATAGTATLISPVTSSNGIATTTFRARAGCVGTDTVTARAQIEGLVFEAQAIGQITILAPVAAGIEFVSVTPATIVLAGRGAVNRPETSEVRFRVRSANGIPVAGQLVEFRLTSNTGGLRLDALAAVTDTVGEVVAVVRSGTAAAVFRVVATLPGGATTQSDQLVVSTGVADQNSFSLSMETLNSESFGIDGVVVKLFVRLSDLYNNPVPNGTNVLFNAEGGQIDPTCTTVDGGCEVRWRSSNPRPANGRITLLARTIGDESFIDANGDGQYSQGEVFSDLPEAFRDDNENGQYDPGEFFSDANSNGRFDPPNGVYDGLLCNATICGRSSTTEIRDDIVHVMSTSRALVSIVPNAVTVNEISPAELRVEVSDLNGNMMAPGTTVEIKTTNGVLTDETSFVIGDSNGPGPFVAIARLIGDGMRSSGSLTVTVKAPSGTTTLASARVDDTSICDQNFAPLPPGCGGMQGNSQIGAITANPNTVLVRPNQTIVHLITLDVRDSSPSARPFSNVVPVASCSPRSGQSGYVVNLLGPIPATTITGQTTARIEVQSSGVISGTFECVFTAGTKTAIVTFAP